MKKSLKSKDEQKVTKYSAFMPVFQKWLMPENQKERAKELQEKGKGKM